MEQRVAALRSQVADSKETRGRVRAEADPGDSWEEYAAALAPLTDNKAFSRLRNQLDGYRRIPIPGIDEERGEELAPLTADQTQQVLAPYSESLRHLRGGTRRVPGERPAQLRMTLDFHLSATFLKALALWEARRLREVGRSDEASEWLLDILIFASDCTRGQGRGGHYLDGRYWDGSLSELRDLLLSKTLSAPAMTSLKQSLQSLNGTLYSHAAYLRRNLLTIGEQILRDGAYQEEFRYSPVSGQNSWRFGFSSRLTSTTAYLWADSWVGRLSEVDRLSWKDLQSMRAEFRAYVDSTRNPVAESLDDQFSPESIRQKRVAQARIGLLSALAGYLQAGSVPGTADPFGDKLRHLEEEGTLRIWSLGTDGVDQGGVGDWDHPHIKDLVIELRR